MTPPKSKTSTRSATARTMRQPCVFCARARVPKTPQDYMELCSDCVRTLPLVNSAIHNSARPQPWSGRKDRTTK